MCGRRGNAYRRGVGDVAARPGDCLLFGDEVDGLPPELREAAGERALRVPLHSPLVRSLNLANAVAIAVSEWRRQLERPVSAAPNAGPGVVPCTQS